MSRALALHENLSGELNMKRVVTGHNEQGKSVFVEVAEPDHVVEAPGMTWREIWATFPDTKVPLNPDYKAEHKSRWTSIFPAVGSTRVRIVQFDPDNREADDTEAAIQRMQSELPGMMEHMEPGTAFCSKAPCALNWTMVRLLISRPEMSLCRTGRGMPGTTRVSALSHGY